MTELTNIATESRKSRLFHLVSDLGQ